MSYVFAVTSPKLRLGGGYPSSLFLANSSKRLRFIQPEVSWSISSIKQKTTAGAILQTDVYANAISDGLNTTISTTQTGATNTTQVVDLLGSVVANIDTTAAGNATGPNSFQSFDEYGQPETPTNQTPASTIQNYGWAGGANRQTETTGLILMGARVYNPVTGQFTSPDPIPGGNETTYTYPNDPINQNDYTGCWPWEERSFWVGLIVGTLTTLIVAGICGATGAVTVGAGCVAAMALAGAFSSGIESLVEARDHHLHGWDLVGHVARGAAVGAFAGVAGGTLGHVAGKIALKTFGSLGKSEILDAGSGYLAEKGYNALGNKIFNKYPAVKKPRKQK